MDADNSITATAVSASSEPLTEPVQIGTATAWTTFLGIFAWLFQPTYKTTFFDAAPYVHLVAAGLLAAAFVLWARAVPTLRKRLVILAIAVPLLQLTEAICSWGILEMHPYMAGAELIFPDHPDHMVNSPACSSTQA
jgi:hypothetical protein